MNTQAGPDITTLNDPEFLAERARVRDALGSGASTELTARMAQLNDEFDRRAAAAWSGAV